jgi:hypothetical protein
MSSADKANNKTIRFRVPKSKRLYLQWVVEQAGSIRKSILLSNYPGTKGLEVVVENFAVFGKTSYSDFLHRFYPHTYMK